MTTPHYDIIVVGAGPSGLSAARTAARLGFRTLVLERLAAPGDLAHPCGAMMAPVPGFVAVQRVANALYFPEVDLSIPAGLITGFPTWQRLIGPNGQEFATPFTSHTDAPVAVVDKPALLRQMAGEAERAGAELRFNAAVIGLVTADGKIAGVRTGEGVFEADMVLSAEGAARRLVEDAGLYAKMPPARRYAFIVSQELEAPAVKEEHLGQIVTLGRRYTSARESFGAVVLPAPGRASVHFTIFADGPRHHSERSLWFYIDEYIREDPRVSPLFVGAQVIGGAGQRLMMRDAPTRVVRNGLIGVGDAVTPGGHLGILPAIYMGRQAAFGAAAALDAGDTSAESLEGYQELLHGPVLSSLETERRLVLGLTQMADDDINRLCETLYTLRQATPYFGVWRTTAWETVAWFVRQFPLVVHDGDLLQQVMNGPLLTAPEPYRGLPAAFNLTAAPFV